MSMSGTCSVRTEKAGTSISISRSKASRTDTLVSGRLISEVGREGAISTAVFIVQRFLLQFLESLALTARGARASGLHYQFGYPVAVTRASVPSLERTAAYARLIVFRRS